MQLYSGLQGSKQNWTNSSEGSEDAVNLQWDQNPAPCLL